jgi:ATP-dependent DNA helicase RecG
MEYREADSIRSIPGVGPAAQANFWRLGLRTLGDVLAWYPRQYIDASHPVPAGDAAEGELVALRLQVIRSNVIRTRNRGVTMVEVMASDDSGEMHLRWFNQPFLVKKLAPGTVWTFIGVVRAYRKERILMNPIIETDPRILSVYAQTKGVTSRQLRGHIEWILEHCTLTAPDVPEEMRKEFEILTRDDVLHKIHRPASLPETEIARKSVAYAETFWFFVRNYLSQRNLRQGDGVAISADVEVLQKAQEALPFTLTTSQKRAVWDIAQDMASGRPMTRLLNGDVGSGKTIVACLAAILAHTSGYQSVFLVPTEVLAQQHFVTLQRFAEPMGLRVGLRTARSKADITNCDLIVGTHALLQEGLEFPRLGLIIIDEQHRFGVRQRKLLRQGQEKLPHVLSMTATPIPRTLALALYGDLSLSFLKDKPADRLTIITEVIWSGKRLAMYRRVLEEITAGHAVFVLCPLIEDKPKEADESTLFLIPEESELQERKSVRAEAERLRKEHPEFGVIGELYGPMKPEEKQQVMQAVLAGEINVLVATSVIEVGIDIPRATVMIIEGAERFGLAQLHQFRGRVGRSSMQSYCFLCPTHSSEVSDQRLSAMVEYESGFDIADIDLQLRGPGDISGLAQSGLPDFRMARLTDTQFLGEVKEATERYITAHPEFIEEVEPLLTYSSEGSLE